NVAVILAGGVGSRAGFSRPKQLVKLGGLPVVAHTIKRFQSHPLIDEICIVSTADHLEEIERLASSLKAHKVKKVLGGGTERRDSSLAAIAAYEHEALSGPLYLIFHDAVRPLVSDEVIDRVINALRHYNAVDVAIPCADTVVSIDQVTNEIISIPDRRSLRLGQTPQAFLHDTISTAYAAALRDPPRAHTDDCGVVLHYLPSEKICVVEGDTYNHKLTYPTDLLILEKFLQSNGGRRKVADTGDRQLTQLRGKSIAIFGGTSGIGEKMAELGERFGAKVSIGSRRNGVDISHAPSVQEFLKEVVATHGKLDAVVNSAAVLTYQPLEALSDEDIVSSVGTNYLGALHVARAAYPYLRESRGHLLFFASSSYTFGRAHYSVYTSSKAAIVNLTQALADEWDGADVKVNCVNPDRTATPMRTRAFGHEPQDQLLDAQTVALDALSVLVGETTGCIFDVERR
ncbi:MAG: SDR family NAD(P)-dependent oxidoreductase, partial [Alphaproteobacteria bacterium]